MMRYPRLLLIWILGLVEEEICGQFFILIAREVCLNDKITLEAKSAQLYLSIHDTEW